MRNIKTVNLVLVILAIFLSLNLITPITNIGGSIVYNLDSSEPECYFVNQDKQNQIPINTCCYEIQKQLHCKWQDPMITCFTANTFERYYQINQKAFNYCQKEGYDVEIK